MAGTKCLSDTATQNPHSKTNRHHEAWAVEKYHECRVLFCFQTTVLTREKPKCITSRLKYSTHPSLSKYSAPMDSTNYRLKISFKIPLNCI